MSQFNIRFLIGDLLFLNLSVLVSILVFSPDNHIYVSPATVYLLVFSNLAWFFLILVSDVYAVSRTSLISVAVKSQLAFLLIHLLMIAALIFFFRQHYSWLQILLIYVTFVPLFIVYRVVLFSIRGMFRQESEKKNYALIGRNDLAQEMRKFFSVNPDQGMKFVGYIDLPDGIFSISDASIFCREKQVHEIYCCIPNLDPLSLHKLINFGLDSLIKVRVVNATSAQSIKLEDYNLTPGFDHSAIRLDEPMNQLLKRIFDLVFSFAFCVLVLSWVLPIVAILIKLNSKGPVFFVQLRSGKSNQAFKCLKFRTMVVNKQSDTLQASKNDARITSIGHFLRKSSIDELPQFINVLIGDMSVVGPRPHMLRHTDEYSKLIETFMRRQYVKPGITGLAQCMGYRGETKDLIDMENRVRLDRYYIENWRFWLDIKIIFLTVISLVRGNDKAF